MKPDKEQQTYIALILEILYDIFKDYADFDQKITFTPDKSKLWKMYFSELKNKIRDYDEELAKNSTLFMRLLHFLIEEEYIYRYEGDAYSISETGIAFYKKIKKEKYF